MAQVLPRGLQDLALAGDPHAPLANVLHDDARPMPPSRNRSRVACVVIVIPALGPEERRLAREERPCALG
eukprot:7429163-Alexandrium_andersonii.AAC.1